MEPGIFFDWENIEAAEFVEDDTYEDMNAPKWIDLAAPDESVEDEAWFCHRDCRHPRTIEGFYSSSNRDSKAKLKRSMTISALFPFRDKKQGYHRQPISLKNSIVPPPEKEIIGKPKQVKTNGLNHSLKSRTEKENQNPNFSAQTLRSKSSAREVIVESRTVKEEPKPCSNFSGRNLLKGREILGQITGLGSKLKNLVMKNQGREKKRESEEGGRTVSGDSGDRVGERDRVPLLGIKIQH